MAKRGINKKNEQKLIEYLLRTTGDIQPLNPIATTSHKKRGRPIERDDRPERSAAKRTLLGEERYPITIKTDDKETMKEISKIKKCSIKQIYNEAISEYINKCINLG